MRSIPILLLAIAVLTLACYDHHSGANVAIIGAGSKYKKRDISNEISIDEAVVLDGDEETPSDEIPIGNETMDLESNPSNEISIDNQTMELDGNQENPPNEIPTDSERMDFDG